MAEYKIVPVDSSIAFSRERQQKLQSIFGHFSATDVQFEWKENKFAVLLHALDFKNFSKEIIEFAENGERDEELKKFSLLILDEIDSIKSYGLKGKKRLYVGYNSERKVQGRAKKVANREPYFYATKNNFSATNHQIQNEFKNKIICADSEELLKKLPDNCVDLIFTSPPYNFGLDYSANHDTFHWENYFEKLFRICSECIRVLKFGGRIAVNVQPLFSDYIPSHHLISKFFIDQKMIWKGEILWEKNNYNCKYTAWGSWKSPSNPYLN
ncbi:MAG: DNA methyltransferase [Limisphaerales bacterium]